MNWRSWLSPCLLTGHEEPIKVLRGKKLHFECPNCQQDLGVVLPQQKLKVKKAKPVRVVRQFTRSA